jgi:hypothetical protein
MQTLSLSLRAAEETPHYLRLLQLGGVSYVLALHRESFSDLVPVAEVASPLRLPVLVFRVPDPLPLVYAVGVGRGVAADAGFRALTDPDFDFRQQVLLADGPVVASAGFAAQLRVLESLPGRLRVAAEFAAPGYLVVIQAHDPRWRARLDGRPASVQRANVGFQAVQVPAGRHEVELEYWPRSFAIGLAISGVSVLLAVAIGLLRRPAAQRPVASRRSGSRCTGARSVRARSPR